MNSLKVLISSISLLYIFFSSCSLANSPVKNPESPGANAPKFTTQDMEGNRVSLEKLLGNYDVVVLNFWGLRCGPCIEEMPHLNNISDKYKKNIAILGVNADGVDGDYLKKQIEKMGLVMEYEIIPDPEFVMVDLYGLIAAPLTIVIDAKGIVRYRHENYEAGDEKKLEEIIKSVLEEK